MIRDAFTSGIQSNDICQRLLENKTLDLQTAFDQAHSQNVACTTKLHYVSQPSILEVIAPIPRGEFEKCSINDTSLAVVKSKGKQNTQSCWFCGNSQYPRNNIEQKLLHAINVKKLDTMKNFIDLQMCLLLYQDLLQCMTRITFLPVYLLVNHSFMKITCLPAYLPVNHTFKL